MIYLFSMFILLHKKKAIAYNLLFGQNMLFELLVRLQTYEKD